MVIDEAWEDTLLELLNSTPVVKGAARDRLADPDAARIWQHDHGGTGTAQERAFLVRARDTLQAVIHGRREPAALSGLLEGVSYRSRVGESGVEWALDAPDERRLAVLAVLAWDAVRHHKPGRLRACGNPECRSFLLDRSKANTARWCSMATCGNRMKARRHHQRQQRAADR